jgi:hypothetical protein
MSAETLKWGLFSIAVGLMKQRSIFGNLLAALLANGEIYK